MFLDTVITCPFSLLQGTCLMNHRSLSTSTGVLDPPVLDCSQPTYRTFSHVCVPWGQVESLVTRYGQLSFGRRCLLFPEIVPAPAFCLPFFPLVGKKAFKPIAL